jgi:hypothetical protein
MSSPQNIVRQVIGGEMGPSAREEGVTEAARRLSHALAEVASILDAYVPQVAWPQGCQAAAQKAKDTVREWGVL